MGPVFALIMMGIIPFFMCGMSCLGKGMKKQAIEKMGQNAKLGKYTEE